VKRGKRRLGEERDRRTEKEEGVLLTGIQHLVRRGGKEDWIGSSWRRLGRESDGRRNRLISSSWNKPANLLLKQTCSSSSSSAAWSSRQSDWSSASSLRGQRRMRKRFNVELKDNTKSEETMLLGAFGFVFLERFRVIMMRVAAGVREFAKRSTFPGRIDSKIASR
jgi:hypothetical protein